MDLRKYNGGKRQNSGRKTKAKEIELIERLTPYDELVLNHLIKGIENGNFACIKLFMEYRYGKPKEQIKIDNQINNQPPKIEFIKRVIVPQPHELQKTP